MTSKRFIELFEPMFGIDEIRSYSGRGMFGDRCVSVNVDSLSELPKVGAEMMQALNEWYGDATTIESDLAHLQYEREKEELLDILAKTYYDNLGLGFVVYWPKLEWED